MTRMLFVSAILLTFLCGCASAGRVVSNLAGAAGGALIGHKLGGGVPVWTAAGAAAGVAASEAVNVYKTNAEAKAHRTGYDQGRSDAVKQLFWMQQNLHNPQLSPQSDQVTLYPIPVPEQEVDGVVQQPTTQYLRIQR